MKIPNHGSAYWVCSSSQISYGFTGLILCALFVFAPNVFGANLTKLSFESVPVELADGKESTIKGTMIFDKETPNTELREFVSEYDQLYDFNNNRNAYVRGSIGDQSFNSPLSVNFPENTNYRAIFLHAYNAETEEHGGCISRFGYWADPELHDNDGLVWLQITFLQQVCPATLAFDGIPTSINVDDWDNATALIQYRVNGEMITYTADLASVVIEDLDAAVVSGSVFTDKNSNCEQDAEEQGLAGRVVNFSPGPFSALTNADGEYQACLPVGTHVATVAEKPLWEYTCADGPTEFVVNSTDDEFNTDFALEATILRQSIDVSLAGSRARPGFEISYVILIQNHGTLPFTGVVSFTHDGVLTDFSSVPEAEFYEDAEALWAFEDLPIGAVRRIEISLRVPPDESLRGLFVCAEVDSNRERDPGDEILSASKDELCTEIRGAVDPNDIQVFSGIKNADGPITRDDKTLSYLIRFQNEGNEDALIVRVVDQLSEFHNIKSVRFGATSHEAEINLSDDGEIEWIFNNIHLAPKSVDEAASQGFVKFEVTLKDELAIGTQIPNSAAIYFDFNRPVITNTVVSRLVNAVTSVTPELAADAVSIYPNPSADRLTVRLEQPGSASLILRNALGQTVLTKTVNSTVQELDLRNLASGSYFLTIETAQGSLVKAVNLAR